MFFDLLQDGFVKSYAEIFRLVNFEEARRQEAGSKTPLWFKKTLEQQPDKLCTMARRLMQAENAMRMGEPVTLTERMFYLQQQLLLWRVLVIAILSVCPSVHHTGGSVKNGAS